jgi:hypothetical protein
MASRTTLPGCTCKTGACSVRRRERGTGRAGPRQHGRRPDCQFQRGRRCCSSTLAVGEGHGATRMSCKRERAPGAQSDTRPIPPARFLRHGRSLVTSHRRRLRDGPHSGRRWSFAASRASGLARQRGPGAGDRARLRRRRRGPVLGRDRVRLPGLRRAHDRAGGPARRRVRRRECASRRCRPGAVDHPCPRSRPARFSLDRSCDVRDVPLPPRRPGLECRRPARRPGGAGHPPGVTGLAARGGRRRRGAGRPRATLAQRADGAALRCGAPRAAVGMARRRCAGADRPRTRELPRRGPLRTAPSCACSPSFPSTRRS